MTKAPEITIIIFLSALSFFLGVKYSEDVREHASWIFESNSDEIELPDLSSTENPEMEIPVDENGKTVDQAVPPAEDQNIVPLIEEGGGDASDQETASQSAVKTSTDKAKAVQPVLKKITK